MRKCKVAVVVAHPDDEVLGFGGVIAKHVAQGDIVTTIIVAEGLRSRGEASDTELQALQQTAIKANKILGVNDIHFLSLPDNELDSMSRLALNKHVETLFAELSPEVVYTHFPFDLNVDHRRVAEAVQVATRPQPGSTCQRLLFGEIPSSTDWMYGQTVFSPNFFIDISTFLERKMMALDVYASEMRPWPHARSLEALTALARWRGAQVGRDAVEAFLLGRELQY